MNYVCLYVRHLYFYKPIGKANRTKVSKLAHSGERLYNYNDSVVCCSRPERLFNGDENKLFS
jgi:hypothetical protein